MLVEQFFRHESGRLTAVLTRVLGTHRVDLVEDVVHSAFLQALRSWPFRGIPDDPAAWLFRVAKNQALDVLRRERAQAATVSADILAGTCIPDPLLERVQLAGEISDSQLRLLCLCCHPGLSPESQVAFALRMLGGFNAAEIARGLLTSESTAQKRLERAKARLREHSMEEVESEDLLRRLPSVLSVIYLLFNEGYNSSRTEQLIRVELCEEALRLGALVTGHPTCRTPEACSLMALMNFHAARFDAREGEDGCLMLMHQQDRQRWDRQLIGEGLRWMTESAQGDVLSPYHLEAGIACEHCLAASFDETNWSRIAYLYDLLVALRPTPVHWLNRGIALAYVHGPQAGLSALAQVPTENIPQGYYLWDAALGELHRRAGHFEEACRHLLRALEGAYSPQERRLLQARLEAARGDGSCQTS